MPQIHSSSVIREIHTETSKGEVTINLNLTIKVDGGSVSVTPSVHPLFPQKKEEDKVLFEMPDIEPVSEADLIKFGKDVQN